MVRRSVLLVAAAVLTACAPNQRPAAGVTEAPTTAAPTTGTTAPATTTAPTTAPPTAASSSKAAPTTTLPATTTPPATTPATPTAPAVASAVPLSAALRRQMTGVSWHAGCPVSLDDLRLLTVPYVGFDGAEHAGVMIVNARVSAVVLKVFATLRAARFPIQRMQLVDDFGGSDDASTLANNTSAFNCRAVYNGTGWSRHAYGLAVDIDPVQNPYVYADGHVLDPNAARYKDRTLHEPGMLNAGDVVVNAFTTIGWRWGGTFVGLPDYQHFDTAP